MHNLLNLIIIALFPLFAYECYQDNLFEAALALGKSFFAFIVAVGFTPELADTVSNIPQIDVVYVRPVVFLILWTAVWTSFKPLLLKALEPPSEYVKYSYDIPGKILYGLLGGFFTASALSVFMLLIPQVEGVYSRESALPPANIHRKGLGVYRTVTFSRTDPFAAQWMEAGAYWLEGEIEQDAPGCRKLVESFPSRYRQVPVETDEFTEHRRELVRQLRENANMTIETGDEEESGNDE
ncbi:MAG: hypothetical protein ACOCSQ_00610 [Planctomycetota bacterium]